MGGDVNAELYSAFAEIYDQVMRDVDYVNWTSHILRLAKTHGVRPARILDLACGSGGIALELARRGYEVAGADQSERMLEIAREKAARENLETSFALAPMQDLSGAGLYTGHDLATCIYDSLNYILEEEGVRACFRETFKALRPGGLFIFDVTTEYNLIHNFAGFTFAENLDGASYIWENAYNLETRVCSSKVTVFLESGGRYEKHTEDHQQRVYATAWLTRELQNAGFDVLGLYHNMTREPVGEKCERVHFAARKPAGGPTRRRDRAGRIGDEP